MGLCPRPSLGGTNLSQTHPPMRLVKGLVVQVETTVGGLGHCAPEAKFFRCVLA